MLSILKATNPVNTIPLMSLPSISEWSYDTRNGNDVIIKWSPAGLLAVSQGTTLTILDARDPSHVTPIASCAPFDSPIGTISWCTGTKSGRTPFDILVTSQKQQAAIYSVTKFQRFCEFSLPKVSVCVSSVWSSLSSFTFYIADDRKTVSMYQLYGNDAKLIWSRNLSFQISFLRVSPFGYDILLAASNSGDYVILDQSQNELASGHLPKSVSTLSNVNFYPFLEDTLMLISKDRVYFYMMKSGKLTYNFEAASECERIVDVVLDPSNERNILVMHVNRGTHFTVKQHKIVKNGVIPILSSGCPAPLLAVDSVKNQFALIMRGGVIQFMKFTDEGDVVCLSVFRLINGEPTDYDIYGTKSVIATKDGYISVLEDSTVVRHFQINTGIITCVKCLSENVFLAVMKSNEGVYEVFYLDMSALHVKNLLPPLMQKIQTDDVQVTVSKSKRFYALVIAERIILLYEQDRHFASIFQKDPTRVTFSDWRDEELLCVTTEWVAKKYVLSGNSHTDTFVCVGTRQISCGNSKPLVAVAVNGLMLCGTDAGNVVVIDWYNKSVRIVDICKSPIFKMSAFKHRCFVHHDKSRVTLLECNDDFELKATKIPQQLNQVKWVDIDHGMAMLPGRNSISLVKATDMTTVTRSVDIHVMETDEIPFEIEYKREVKEISQDLRHNGFCLMSDMIESTVLDVYSPLSGGANLTLERMNELCKTVELVFGGAGSLFKERVRLEVLLDNYEDALQMLCRMNRSSPAFALTTMKAALVGCRLDEDVLNQIVGHVIDGRLMDDAADILLLCGSVREAARILLTLKETQMAIMCRRAMNKDDESDQILTAVTNFLILNQKPVQAAAVKAAFGEFTEASEILKDEGYDLLSYIIGAIAKCSPHGRIRFSF